MKKIIYKTLLLTILTGICSCNSHYSIPENATPVTTKAKIFPDYTNIVIPANIAPLNFVFQETGDAFICSISGGSNEPLIAGSDETGIIQFDINQWRKLLSQNKGKTLKVNLYKQKDGKWIAYPAYTIDVAEEPIDDYFSYRLIEPGFELYRLIGLYQRNLTNFDVKAIIENPRLTYVKDKTYCVNCHNYQNYSTKRMLFHARSSFGGTIIAHDGIIEKLNTKSDSILGSAVYPAWHPTLNVLLFSSNKTGQVFQIRDHQKIEVIDRASDLIFYNVSTHQISNVVKSHNDLETFPTWAPSGDMAYYCVATTDIHDGDPDSVMDSKTIIGRKNLKYNLMRIPFNQKTMTFGQPELEFDAKAFGKSVSVPRVSPDGRYILFTLGEYGQFHIWHKSSDLYIKDLKTGQVYPLTEANSSDVDSYHTWSSNGRWIVFSSRRDDGSYTRSYITYFDKHGKAHKAFMLPQEDPTYNLRLFKSFNVPELTKDAVPYDAKQMVDAVYSEAVPVNYKEIRPGFKK